MLKNHYLILIFTILITSCGTAQPARYSTSKKSAIKLYEQGRAEKVNINGPNWDQYERLMKQAIEKDPNFIEPYQALLEFYSQLEKFDKGAELFDSYIKLDNPYRSRTDYYMGADLNIKTGNYEKAKEYGEAFRKIYSATRSADPELIRMADALIANCNFAIEAKKNKVPFDPVNVGPGINTSDPEYFPTLTADDSTMYFTRRVQEQHAFMGAQEDVYVSFMDGEGYWNKGLNLGPEMNRRYKNEGAPSISANGQVLVMTICEDQSEDKYGRGRQGYGSCDLFLSYKKGNSWTPPVNVGKPVNTWDWETQPSISADGNTIYFIRGKRTLNGKKVWPPHDPNIYVTRRLEDNSWSIPEKLNICTPQKESSVVIHPDGQTLYFSSDGYPGMGDSDLYVSYLEGDGKWGIPKNLGYPINTHKMENSLMVSSKGEVAFFASDREGGYGSLDIYSFILPENRRPNYTTYMKGIVFDSKTSQRLEAGFELVDLATGKKIVESFSDPENGSFMVTIPTNRDYALNVTKDGYLLYSENFSMTEKTNKEEPLVMNVPLVPIEKVADSDAITLKNVFFDLDKTTLKPESKIELDKMYGFLMQNSTIKIELRGHTDNQGEADYNMKLSEGRAKAVVDYLIKKGIDSSRLSSKGFGKTKPKTTNDTKEGRAQNRRTEYVIIK